MMPSSTQASDFVRLSGATTKNRKQSSALSFTKTSGQGYPMSQTATVGGGPIAASLNGGINGASNVLKGSDEPLTIKNVTPELAAQVVKHFVLPMFDTDYKKGLRRKYGRMQAAAISPAIAGMTQQTSGAHVTSVAGASDLSGLGTVLGDLKLTEHLSNELDEVRNKFDSMHEALERVALERDAYKKKFVVLNSKNIELKV